jgi:hypothetical protein
MALRGTTFQRIGAPAPPAPPPALAKIGRIDLATLRVRVPDKARLALQALTAPGGSFALSPINWVGLAVGVAIWCAAFFVLGVLVITLTFDEVSMDASLPSPAPHSMPPALLLTPLVHVSLEPLVIEPLAPAMPISPRATPHAAGRPPLVLPTLHAPTK